MNIDSVLIYDQDKNLYNFPFILEYDNHVENIDFYFTNSDFKNSEEMLRSRVFRISEELLDHYMMVFEHLQEICLDDSIEANNGSVDNINKLLNTLLSLYNIFSKIHCNPNITSRLYESIEELLEMFLLLEDYYTIERKVELHTWKNKFLGLKKF
jgi:hypothetical protein